MWKRAVATALAICATGAAHAQQQCGPRDHFVAYLADEYGESRQMIGLHQNGQIIIEVWGNADTGTWTITATGSDGVTCLLSDGGNFELISEQLQGTVY